MPLSQNQELKYSEFIQACRAFKPSDLIPEIAITSIRLGDPPYSNRILHQVPPWGLAAAARESILYGNEYRSKPVTHYDIIELMRKFQLTRSMYAQDEEDGLVTTTLTRLAYEQFPYQESIFEELSRTHAWMIESIPEVETEIISEDTLTTILDGVPVRDAIGATLLIYVGAQKHSGRFDYKWLDQHNFKETLKLYPRENIEKLIRRITTTPEEFKAAYNFSPNPRKPPGRFDYNHLAAKPFIDFGDGRIIAPSPSLILRTVSPGALYYPGVKKYGDPFSRDLGLLFENYIGRQLKLLNGAVVLPEIKYGKGGGKRSVDWFVIFPELVILVEVKSNRLGASEKSGAKSLINTLSSKIGRAKNQIKSTAERISAKDLHFSDIPTDRPILGLIVTAEPFYTSMPYLHLHEDPIISYPNIPNIPVSVISARNIESMTTQGMTLIDNLLEYVERRKHGPATLEPALRKVGPNNPILQQSWDNYSWPSHSD